MARRAGQTTKLSISLDERDLATLKKRAKRFSDGNISAAVADMIRLTREWEGREALAAWLGEGRAEPSAETMNAVRKEWSAPPAKRRRTRAA